MQMIEGNVLHINGEQCTIEFQPSADQAWQVWANNVLPASATYPSPYANVHKGDLCFVGGSIGDDGTSKWQTPTMTTRNIELQQLNNFKKTLKETLSDKTKHVKLLEFMASNGIRQLGEPIIGMFADRQRPDPLHLEINSWQHVLDVIYRKAVQMNAFKMFIDILKGPVKPSDASKGGCGLPFAARSIEEHFASDKTRDKLKYRLIGEQAIKLARYSYCLIDELLLFSSSEAENIFLYALAKICEYLRDIGSMINRVDIPASYPEDVNRICTLYFNIFALFFSQSCNVTVWTMGYVIPFHVKKLYDEYKIGFGILSMQGKESKHSQLKQELKTCTNRSISHDENGKWYQLMISSYVRTFYLPYHFPATSPYHSHYTRRVAEAGDNICRCSRTIIVDGNECHVCINALEIIESAERGKISDNVTEILKPFKCTQCLERFAHKIDCDKHLQCVNVRKLTRISQHPKDLKLVDIKKLLEERNLSMQGTKKELVERLEAALSSEF